MHRKLARVLVSGPRAWEAGVGRKLKFHCILSCSVVYELFIFQEKNKLDFFFQLSGMKFSREGKAADYL